MDPTVKVIALVRMVPNVTPYVLQFSSLVAHLMILIFSLMETAFVHLYVVAQLLLKGISKSHFFFSGLGRP